MLQLLLMQELQIIEATRALSWSAYEHDHTERSADWFWALGITALCLAAISILLNNVFFALLILVAAATIAVQAKARPHFVHFALTERGIRVGNSLHSYDEILAFWVEEEHKSGRPHLLIDTTKPLSPNLIIPLDTVDPRAVRSYLAQRVKEQEMAEPLSYRIFDWLGF